MMMSEAGVIKARNGRKGTGRAASHGRGLLEVAPKVMAMADMQRYGSSGGDGAAAGGTNSIPVTFWSPDGSCYEGTSPLITGDVIFVESTQLIPVEQEVTIRFTQADDVLGNRGVAKGTVVWHCTSSDHFKSRKGFGVCLQDRWPQPPGPAGNDASKEPA